MSGQVTVVEPHGPFKGKTIFPFQHFRVQEQVSQLLKCRFHSTSVQSPVQNTIASQQPRSSCPFREVYLLNMKHADDCGRVFAKVTGGGEQDKALDASAEQLQ